jgi:hypothetical protein
VSLQVQTNSYAVDILTAHYRVSGEIRILGNPIHYLNDQLVSSLTVYDATLVPIQSGVRVSAMSAEELYVPKTEPQIIILGSRAPDETSPLPKSENMVCFTDTYVVRGTFHMRQDVQTHDTFSAEYGPYFLVSKLNIATLYAVAVEVKAMANQAYILGTAVRAFFAPEDGPPAY